MLTTPFTLQHKSQTSNNQSEIDASTKQQVSDVKSQVEKNRQAVIDKVLERVVQCEPKLHRNLQKVQ